MTNRDQVDPELEAALEEIIRSESGPSDCTVDDAISAFDDHCRNGPIARLVLDSADLSMSVRGGADRQVVFEGAGLGFDMIVSDERVAGQLLPAAARTIELVGRHGWREAVVTDDDGYFEFTDLPSSAFYLCCRQGPIRTSWITH